MTIEVKEQNNSLPFAEQELLERGELPTRMDLGPWREKAPYELVNPNFVEHNSNGQEIIPGRLPNSYITVLEPWIESYLK